MEGKQVEVAKFLIERGVDLNAETIEDQLSPLYIAKLLLGESHPITELLIEAGAEDVEVYVDSDENDEDSSMEYV